MSVGDILRAFILSGFSHIRIEYFFSPMFSALPTPGIRLISSKILIFTKLERKLPSYLSSPLIAIRQTIEGDFLSTTTPCAVTSGGREEVAVETLF